jgi:hypothetical protein
VTSLNDLIKVINPGDRLTKVTEMAARQRFAPSSTHCATTKVCHDFVCLLPHEMVLDICAVQQILVLLMLNIYLCTSVFSFHIYPG